MLRPPANRKTTIAQLNRRMRRSAGIRSIDPMGFFDRSRASPAPRSSSSSGSRRSSSRADAPEQRSRPIDVETIEALEEALISADVGVAATERIVDAVRARARRGDALRALVKDEILAILRRRRRRRRSPAAPARRADRRRQRHRQDDDRREAGAAASRTQGQTPLICAADTFRAAAVEQLEVWATRAGVDIIRAQAGADPAAVVFDAIAAGKAREPRRRS